MYKYLLFLLLSVNIFAQSFSWLPIKTNLPNNYLIRDREGNLDWFVYIPKFCWDTANGFNSTQVHPAFLDTNATGGITNGFYCAKYEASNIGGVPRSLQGKIPWVSVNYDTAVAVCDRKNFTGQKKFHLLTNAQRAAIALWCKQNSTQPYGNNYWGCDYDQRWVTGALMFFHDVDL